MNIVEESATARDAAERFAESYSDEPRKVGTVVTPPDAKPCEIDFQFVGGVRWYSVRMAPDYSGWIVGPHYLEAY